MKPFRTGVVACAVYSTFAFAQSDYSAALATSAPAAKPASSSDVVGPRTGLYGSVMKGNAASDNTVDDFTKRGHLIDRQYLAGWGGADLVNAGYSFEAIGLNWFGAAYGGGSPDEVRFGIASAGKFSGGLMVALNKVSTEDTLATVSTKTKTVLETDGFGAFGSFAIGNAGDVYGEVSVLTGFDDLATGNDNYIKFDPAGTEVTPRIIHLMGGWKKDATAEGTHALNAELILNVESWENKPAAAAATAKRSITDVQLWFYHGYILKDAGTFKVFAGSNSLFQFQTRDWDSAPTDRSLAVVSVTPNMSFQKTLGHGFEATAGAGVSVAWVSLTNMPSGANNLDQSTSFFTAGTDMAVGLRWAYENFAFEGAVKEALLANGPQFIGGNAAPGMFAQIGMSVGF